jgi:hypothetical protein
VTNSVAADVNTGVTQLFVGVSAVGSNQVAFRFFNTGPNPSSICDIYFDDGSLLGIASITNQAGVAFSEGASPKNLPGGNAINFAVTKGFLADSDPPVQPMGVNPGEQVIIKFDLINGLGFADTITAMDKGLLLGSHSNDNPLPINLRIGIHVQGFDGGGSESFVNGPPVVPLPPAVMAGSVLLGGVGLRRWSRART